MFPLLAGCVGSSIIHEEPGDNTELQEDKKYVTLNLSVGVNGGTTPTTRALFGQEEDGTFESSADEYEMVHTLRVVIVRKNTGIIEHNRMVLVKPTYVEGGIIDNYHVMNDNLRFKVEADEEKTIYLFANEKAVNLNKEDGEVFDFETELHEDSIFPTNRVRNLLIKRIPGKAFIDNDSIDPQTEKYYIPMSEYFDVQVKPLSGTGETLQEEAFFLTRSLIKFSFSVALAPDMDVTDLQKYLRGVSISNLANVGYYLPIGTTYVPGKDKPSENEYGGREITGFEVPSEMETSDCTFRFDKPIKLTKEGDDRRLFIYLPESKLTQGGYNLSLLFSDDEEDKLYAPKPLQYRNSAGTLSNTLAIPRDTHMKVNILLKSYSMEATVTLFPYTAVDLKPSFGFGVPVESVHITEENPVVTEGQTISLVGYVLPKDANNKDIIWTSKEPDIATVTNDGSVTGVSEGTTVITATSVDDPTKSATCMVTVNPEIPVTGFSLSQSTWTGNVEATVNLSTDITPADATNKGVIWESEDENIAKVSSYGTVTAVNPGTTTITAIPEGNRDLKATCLITVNPRTLVSSVSISPATNQTIVEGGQLSFTATVSPSTATNQDINWSSSNDEIATVSSYGMVTAIKAGTATIRAEAADGSGKVATCTVTVTAKNKVTSVSVEPNTLTLRETQKQTLTATVLPDNATYKNVVWTSDNPYVATAGGSTVTAINEGTANITVTSVDDPTKFATCKVTVLPKIPVTGIDITRGGSTVTSWTDATPGNTRDIRATITPSEATDKTVVWTSNNESVATVTFDRIDTDTDPAKYGTTILIVHAIKKGTATITVTSSSNPEVSTIYEVTVN